MSAPPYQNHYGVQILDDIHNYFPAVLYEPERFRSVTELLQYIRLQTRNRFDLFTAGQIAHMRGMEVVHTHSSPMNIHSRSMMRPRMEIAPITQTIVIDEAHDNLQGLTTQILRELLAPGAVNPTLNSVIVHPTHGEIATATTVETVGEEGEMCAICQDTIGVGTEARTLNFCEHSFHIGCIDTWFTRNVRCPVCRHDIREVE